MVVYVCGLTRMKLNCTRHIFAVSAADCAHLCKAINCICLNKHDIEYSTIGPSRLVPIWLGMRFPHTSAVADYN